MIGRAGSSNMNTTNYGSELDSLVTTETPLTTYTYGEVVVICVVVVSLIIVIIAGNAVVVCLVVINRRMRPVQNLFIASLAVSDLCVGLLIMPLSLANELMGYWCFGKVLCELWLAFDVLSCTASILNLCLISVDRYLCITRAMTYPRWRDKNKCIIMIGVVWLMAMLVCLPPLAGWKRPQPTKNGLPLCVLSSEVGYIIYSTLGSFFIPLVVMVAVYIQIYRAVKHQVRRRFSVRYDLQQPPTRGLPHQDEIRRFIPNNDVSDREEHLEGHEDLEEYEMDAMVFQAREFPDKQDTDDQATYPTLTDEEKYNTEEDEMQGLEILPYDTRTSESGGHQGDMPSGGNHDEDLLDGVGGSQVDTDLADARLTDCGGHDTHVSDITPSGESGTYAKQQTRDLDDQGIHRPAETVTSSGSDKEYHPNLQTSNIDTHKKHCQMKRTTKLRILAPRHHSYTVVGMLRSRAPKLNLFQYFHMRRSKKIPLLHKDCLTEVHEQKKWRIARARERRLTLILGVIMAAFVICWFPFFSTYLISSITGFHIHKTVFDVFFWAGYCNSAFNPIIYTIFNRDIRLCKSR